MFRILAINWTKRQLSTSRVGNVISVALLGAGVVFSVAVEASSTLHESQTVEIAAPADRVWSVIGNYADLTWVPAVKGSVATNGNNRGSIRALDLGGVMVLEQLVNYDASRHSYSYKIVDVDSNHKVVPVRHFQAVISVTPVTKDSSKVTWEASFERVDQSATPVQAGDDTAAQQAVSGVLNLGLSALKSNVKVD